MGSRRRNTLLRFEGEEGALWAPRKATDPVSGARGGFLEKVNQAMSCLPLKPPVVSITVRINPESSR